MRIFAVMTACHLSMYFDRLTSCWHEVIVVSVRVTGDIEFQVNQLASGLGLLGARSVGACSVNSFVDYTPLRKAQAGSSPGHSSGRSVGTQAIMKVSDKSSDFGSSH